MQKKSLILNFNKKNFNSIINTKSKLENCGLKYVQNVRLMFRNYMILLKLLYTTLPRVV